jgi:hypothetical protein
MASALGAWTGHAGRAPKGRLMIFTAHVVTLGTLKSHAHKARSLPPR